MYKQKETGPSRLHASTSQIPNIKDPLIFEFTFYVKLLNIAFYLFCARVVCLHFKPLNTYIISIKLHLVVL